jgi:DNA-binding transcriptional ArsR family regulator
VVNNQLSDHAVGELFGALADPTRRRIVELLGTRPLRPGELTAAVGTSSPAMSRHLRVLLTAGLVTDERDAADARARVFRLRMQPVGELQAWLGQLQEHWDAQLESFRAHVEREAQE